MTPEQLVQIQETIKQTVNGKIDILTMKLENYITEDNNWKKNAEPVIELGNDMRGFGKTGAYVLGFLATVGAIVITFIKLFKLK